MSIFDRFIKKDRVSLRQPKFQPVVGFEESSSLRFTALDGAVRLRLKELLQQLTEDINLEEKESNMLRANSYVCNSLDQVLQIIGSVWHSDYSDNQVKSKNEGWDFFYFVPKMQSKNNFLLIIANLYYPPAEFENNVLYNLVAIKTDGSSYFVWDMTN